MSFIEIEQTYFHRIEIKSISSLYRLSIKLKKPIILSLYTLPVLIYVIEHPEVINSILGMENLWEIKIAVPGYGVFNQKYELERISGLFSTLAQGLKNGGATVRRIWIEMPGWRAFSNDVTNNLFKLIQKCTNLEEFTLNLNRVMNLCPQPKSDKSENSQKSSEEYFTNISTSQNEEETYYGRRLFEIDQFRYLMKNLCDLLPGLLLNKIELRFGAWEGVDSVVMEILIESIKKIYAKMKNIKVLKLDISGWGAGDSAETENEIDEAAVEKLFRTIEEFDGESSELLEIDMRFWPSKYKIGKYKDRFLYLSGAKRKDEFMSSIGPWSMSATNFYGSQMKSKIVNRMKVEIKD